VGCPNSRTSIAKVLHTPEKILSVFWGVLRNRVVISREEGREQEGGEGGSVWGPEDRVEGEALFPGLLGERSKKGCCLVTKNQRKERVGAGMSLRKFCVIDTDNERCPGEQKGSTVK